MKKIYLNPIALRCTEGVIAHVSPIWKGNKIEEEYVTIICGNRRRMVMRCKGNHYDENKGSRVRFVYWKEHGENMVSNVKVLD